MKGPVMAHTLSRRNAMRAATLAALGGLSIEFAPTAVAANADDLAEGATTPPAPTPAASTQPTSALSAADTPTPLPKAAAPRLNEKLLAAAGRYRTGAYGGRSTTWVENVVVAAGGPRIYLGTRAEAHEETWLRWCAEQSWLTAQPGDICYWYDPSNLDRPVHTAILSSGDTEQTASVMDSDFNQAGSQVDRGTWTSRDAAFAKGSCRIWRVR